ncbi:hypothetical protein GH714_042144 [Hevea brasiliensis]|uniref:Bet v I/Major latex protein domain-containing protein n=1 Tax=Hevea brasiliensis TaxID=3981 RepID=A0A6A6MXA6_HEVBR|nr:hypothetical protein GH714_042144 [Hevea brasiliensis]
MAQADKLEADVELNAPADNFYKIFTAKHTMFPMPLIVFTQLRFMKEKADVDEANKTITFTAVEGHVLEQYKSYKAILRVIPTGDGGLVKICVEYEKLKADDPPPSKYLDILVSVVKDVDAHLVKA